MAERFQVGLTADFLTSDGRIGFVDIGQDMLEAEQGLAWEFLPEHTPVLTPEMIAGYDALAVNAPRVTADTLAGNDRLALIARFGVGYDNVDLEACTRTGVAVTITPDAARRPVALIVVTWILALSHRLLEKDRVTREGQGWARKLDMMGYGLTGKTVGIIGLGNIGGEVARLVQPFGMRVVATGPRLTRERAAAVGATAVDLETLLAESDFVVICCGLNAETRHLLNAERLGLMKLGAFLLNPSRGAVVDQAALVEALRAGRIRGAALDVFEQEPVDPNDPILQLDNVLLAPHALCWTDEWARTTGESVMGSILAVKRGELPGQVVNREVLESPLFLAKLERLRG